MTNTIRHKAIRRSGQVRAPRAYFVATSDRTTYRRLTQDDSTRIPCMGFDGPPWMRHRCHNQASWCQTVRWQVGDRPGTSFFYLCDDGYSDAMNREEVTA